MNACIDAIPFATEVPSNSTALAPRDREGPLTPTAPAALHISNEDFLQAVLGELKTGESAWICGFPEAPTSKARWGGQPVKLGEAHSNINPNICNTYYSVAVIAGHKRQKKFSSRMAVLVVDDVALETLNAPPSYVIETSPGNHQAGYIISSGGDDPVRCDRVMAALHAKGMLGSADKSGNNIVRYVRLPVGVNTKPRNSGPFAHRLTVWQPRLRYTLDDAAAALGIDLAEAKPAPQAIDKGAPTGSASSMSERLLEWRATISDRNLDKRSYHDAINKCGASLLATGMAAGAVVEMLRAEMMSAKPTAEQCEAQGRSLSTELKRWQERYDDIPRAVGTAQEKFSVERERVSPEAHIDPVDLWGKIVAPAAKPEFFPRAVSDYAFEVAQVSGFDPGFMAMAAMVALAGSIHDGIKIQCKRNDPTFLQDPRLWLALVGPPSAKKSPVLKKVFARLYEIEEKLREEYGKAMKEHVAEMARWKAECKKLNYAFGAKAPEQPQPPPLIRLVVSDTTVERLQMVLAKSPRGVIQVRDELSGWFGSHGAYGDQGSAGKDVAHWLQLYDGGPLLVDRVGRNDEFVSNWGASVIGSVQPDAIRKIVSKLPNDGLLQRFIPVIGQRHQETDRQIDMGPVNAFDQLLERLYSTSPVHGTLPMVRPVKMHEDADKVRKRVFEKLGGLITTFENGSTRLASHVGKWEGLYCRLVLVVHCVECAERAVHPTEEEVSRESAERVGRLMFQYLMPHLMAFYEDVLEEGGGAGQTLDDVRKIGEHILTKGWHSFTDRDVTHAVKRWRHRNVREKVERYATLEAMGWISPVATPDQRGIAARYQVNPAVHTKFTEQGLVFKDAMAAVADLLKPGATA